MDGRLDTGGHSCCKGKNVKLFRKNPLKEVENIFINAQALFAVNVQ